MTIWFVAWPHLRIDEFDPFSGYGIKNHFLFFYGVSFFFHVARACAARSGFKKIDTVNTEIKFSFPE
jgi:hypothetical protein